MIYKIEKKLPVGYLGTIYLLQWETEDEAIDNDFKKLKYFCVYYPDSKNVINLFETDINDSDIIDKSSSLYIILNDYIKDQMDHFKDHTYWTLSGRCELFPNPEEAIFYVFEKLYAMGKLIK